MKLAFDPDAPDAADFLAAMDRYACRRGEDCPVASPRPEDRERGYAEN